MSKSSYETLKKRFCDEKFLQEAAARRDALDYDKISFGKLSKQKNYIRMLLPQAHSCFYSGNYHAVISMCGIMLEAVLHLKVKTHFAVTKCIEYKPGPNRNLIFIKDPGDLDSLSLNDLIGVCYQYKYLSNELFQDLRNIQRIRNITVHEKMPFFTREEDEYVLDLGKNQIRYKREDVKLLIQNTIALTAFYCLTKTRFIFHSIVKNIEE